jgi:peroxiredoxin
VIDEQGKILLAYPKVNPNEHLDAVLRDLGAKK